MQATLTIAHTTDHLTTSTVNRSQTLSPSPSVILTAFNINNNRFLVVSHYHHHDDDDDHDHDELYIMSTSTSTRSNSTTVPVHTRPNITCKIDPDILNENSLQDMNDIGLSFFASVCGKNRGAFVLDPPDGNTYGWYVTRPTSFLFYYTIRRLFVCLVFPS